MGRIIPPPVITAAEWALTLRCLRCRLVTRTYERPRGLATPCPRCGHLYASYAHPLEDRPC